MKIKETDLYKPLKNYLEKQDYVISSEVRNCDMVARKGDEMIILELKLRFSLDLVYQAIRRSEIADSVYVAVAVPPGKKIIPRFRDARALLRRLGIGLILVRLMKTKTRIEIALHPGEYSEKKRHRRRMAILREIDARYAEFNKAGSVSTDLQFSAYRQRALYLAWLLKIQGPSSPSRLREAGGPEQSQSILSNNFYGWFERVKYGTYDLSDSGQKILKTYKKQLNLILNEKKK